MLFFITNFYKHLNYGHYCEIGILLLFYFMMLIYLLLRYLIKKDLKFLLNSISMIATVMFIMLNLYNTTFVFIDSGLVLCLKDDINNIPLILDSETMAYYMLHAIFLFVVIIQSLLYYFLLKVRVDHHFLLVIVTIVLIKIVSVTWYVYLGVVLIDGTPTFCAPDVINENILFLHHVDIPYTPFKICKLYTQHELNQLSYIYWSELHSSFLTLKKGSPNFWRFVLTKMMSAMVLDPKSVNSYAGIRLQVRIIFNSYPFSQGVKDYKQYMRKKKK